MIRMSAKEMFEKLGYRQTVDYDSIRYRHLTDYIDESVVFHTGNLFPKTYDVWCLEWRDNKIAGWIPMDKREINLKHCAKYGHWQKVDYGVDASLHNAINKQICELGWNNEN